MPLFILLLLLLSLFFFFLFLFLLPVLHHSQERYQRYAATGKCACDSWLRKMRKKSTNQQHLQQHHHHRYLYVCGAAAAWETELQRNHSSQHEKCDFVTGYEDPLPGSEPFIIDEKDSKVVEAITKPLVDPKYVARDQERTPAFDIALRNINEKEYQVISRHTNEVIDSIDEARAFFEVYPGAIYLQQGRSYLVTYLDVHELVAYVQPLTQKPTYYTSQADHREVTVTHVLPSVPSPPKARTNRALVAAKHGRVIVTTSVFSYHKISVKTGYMNSSLCTAIYLVMCQWRYALRYVLDTVPLHLPPIQVQTRAFWVDVPPYVQMEVTRRGLDFKGGIHGAAHALAAVTPLRLLCDHHSDLATECPNIKENAKRPSRLLIYERHKGGLGVSAMGSALMPQLLLLAHKTISSCPCACPHRMGCPQCVQSSCCPEYNEVMDKEAALMILEKMIEITR
eukprot:jgi/Bigna1/66502/fgenesh1_pg.1_\